MYSLEVPSWKSFAADEFDYGIYLWVLHADKVPPHIGISRNGLYFSLKVSGKDEAIPVRKVMQLLDKKAVPSLIIKTSENSILFKDLSLVFNKYTKAGIPDDYIQSVSKLTCLTPITEIYFSEPKDLILSELLNLLNEAGVMETIYGTNLSPDFKGIPRYERKDIEKRLDHLNHAKRTKNISAGH